MEIVQKSTFLDFLKLLSKKCQKGIFFSWFFNFSKFFLIVQVHQSIYLGNSWKSCKICHFRTFRFVVVLPLFSKKRYFLSFFNCDFFLIFRYTILFILVIHMGTLWLICLQRPSLWPPRLMRSMVLLCQASKCRTYFLQ